MFRYIKFIIGFFITFNAFAQDFQIVKKFYAERPANLAVNSKGEIFATMHPMDDPKTKIVKISKNGEFLPFDYSVFQAFKSTNQGNYGIVNAIGIFITKQDILWVLDMGGEVLGVKVSPKFIVWDLKSNKLEKIITLPEEVLKKNSFVQDFALDEKENFAFIADMTIGGEASPAIIAVNVATGEAKRLLNSSKFLRAEKPLMAEGVELGKMDINPIAIDPLNEWVYFGAMNEGVTYRIKSSDLRNFANSDKLLESKIQKYGYKPHSDGFKIDEKGNIYTGDVQNFEIGIINEKGYKSYLKSQELAWVDGVFIANDGFVYAVVNQLNRHKNFAGGTEKAKKPYIIIKFKQVE